MKKIILFILISALLISTLIACNKQNGISSANPWEDPSLSKEHAAIRKISDAAIMQKYGFEAKDLFLYQVTINPSATGGTVVFYKLCFYGYDTYEHYWVNLSSDLALENVTDSDFGVYSQYIPHVNEEKVRNADIALDEKLKKYETVSEKYLSIDENGNLCLTAEVIENIDPPIADENGNTSGCGLDHRHLLLTEIICIKK